jgi:DNA-binding response OmpR family regulator
MKTVLLAQRDKALREKEQEALAEGGFRVLLAEGAEEALGEYESQGADLVIADLDLPRMGGDALCSRIREQRTGERVYVGLVCAGRRPELGRCGRCDADGVIQAPVDVTELVHKVRRILRVPGRVAPRVLAKVIVRGALKGEYFFCTSRNVSISGILLETERALARGDQITASFFLPDGARVDALGEVVRVAKGEDGKQDYGVRFVRMEPKHLEGLRDFVEKERRRGNFP